MREILDSPVLIVDCQTTGMRPSSGRILEVSWTSVCAGDETPCLIESEILRWPEAEALTEKIREITGIEEKDFAHAKDEAEVFPRLQSAWAAIQGSRAIAHYAQFERAFLEDWFAKKSLAFEFELFCSQRIAKKLFPEMPSQNIRALAGFFGYPYELKRADSHVRATVEIWRRIARRLHETGIGDFRSLTAWMKEKKTPQAVSRYQYRMDRFRRLALNNKPGVYRMIAKDGRILYVGKATSLRSRVNSYFRGQKGRDRRKLEMLAQVWDLKITECETPLEAALLETDEIKRWNPPYNVSLKAASRQIVFYSRNFLETSTVQGPDFPIGPFRGSNVLDSLRLLYHWVRTGELGLVFYQEIDPQIFTAGFVQFCERQKRDVEFFSDGDLRRWLAFGMSGLRAFVRRHPGEDMEEVFAREKAESDRDEDGELTALDVAGKIERLFLRSAFSLRRARQMTRLLNSKIRIPMPSGDRTLVFRDGKLDCEASGRLRWPWARAGIADFDRMSILLSEVQRRSYSVETLALST